MAENESLSKKTGKAAVNVGAKGTAPEDLYQAKYVGSGTFIIKKPKRNSRKTHQQRVKNDRRGRI
jgi:hypothetical protein